MALPPSGYPSIRGKACGEDWTVPTEVTGHLPGTGFGGQFKHTVTSVTNNYALIINIGENRQEQIEYAEKIRLRITIYRRMLQDSKQAGPLRFTKKERKQIRWLLDRADAYLEAADDLWVYWFSDREGGNWPLNFGDELSDFAGGVCPPEYIGSWIETRAGTFKCPSQSEIDQRKRDRKKIGQLFNDALAHLYCAMYGYWRLRLYKEAYDAYVTRPTAGLDDLVAQPQPPGPGPHQLPDLGLAGAPPPDPCKDFGIDCPPGEEPEDCPGGWCPPDPDDLPEPEDIPDLGPGLGEPPDLPVPVDPAEQRRRRGGYLIAGGAATLVVTTVLFAVLR